MKFYLKLLICNAMLLPLVAMAAPGWIISTSSESVHGGEMLKLEIVQPDKSTPWPGSFRLKIISDKATETVNCYPDKDVSENSVRRVYIADLPRQNHGLLKIELADMPSNRLLINVAGPVDPSVSTMASPVEPSQRLEPMPENEAALSISEPIYFVIGLRKGLNARFQFSFKYRIFDPESAPVQWLPALGKLHFGYTQTTLWDLHSNSKPYYDTSYRPTLFWQSKLDERATNPAYIRSGYEHESNGKEGTSSRSIDIFYVQPVLRKDFTDDDSLFFAPRFYGYLDRKDNPDIARYRGYVDWIVRYGDERSWVLLSRIRAGTAGYAGAAFDLSVPLRKPLFSRTGGFLYFQLFSGYGESLLDYNIKSPPQLRIGFSIVR